MHMPHFKHYIIEMSHRHGRLVILQALVAISNTLSNSFVLIYLLREGHSYLDCGIFMFLNAAVSAVLVAFASRTIIQNFVASMTTALACLILYFFSLAFLHGWYLVLVPPILFGTYIATFWVPYHALIMHVISRKKRGAIVGVYFLIWPAVTTISPLVAGVVILAGSYMGLFLLSASIAIVNLIFVSGLKVLTTIRNRIIIPELLQSLKVNLVGKLQVDLDLKGVDWRIKSALFAEGIQDGVFWIFVPLVTFEFAKSEVAVGGYLSLFAFWGGVMTVALGYLSDRLKDRAAIVRIGAAFGAISVVVAASAGSAQEYASAMSIAYFWIAMVPSFLFAMLVDKLEKFKKKGVLIREFFINSGRTAGAGIVVCLIGFGMDISISMLVAGIALASMIIVR